jgi:hypothetical protein
MAAKDRQRRRNQEPNRRRSNSLRRRRQWGWHHEASGNTEDKAWCEAMERLNRREGGTA